MWPEKSEQERERESVLCVYVHAHMRTDGERSSGEPQGHGEDSECHSEMIGSR